MKDIKTSQDFDQDLSKKHTFFTGLYDLGPITDYICDYPFEKRLFKDCIIIGGSFTASNFDNCTFENVLISDSNLTVVQFRNCEFNNCIFNNTTSKDDLGYTFENCQISKLSIKTEPNLDYQQATTILNSFLKGNL